jgi:hypothetical protein
MTLKKVRLHAGALGTSCVVAIVAFALVFAMAPLSLAQRYPDGGSSSVPYAPYTAGPVVREVPMAAYTPSEKPYAPYTAGPVVREVPLVAYAPYTAGPVVRETPLAAYTPATEKPYAPYTAGPVVHGVPFSTSHHIPAD